MEHRLVFISLFLRGIAYIGIYSGILGFQLKHVMIAGSVLGFLYQGGGYLIVIMTGGVGKNGSTGMLELLTHLCQPGNVCLCLSWYYGHAIAFSCRYVSVVPRLPLTCRCYPVLYDLQQVQYRRIWREHNTIRSVFRCGSSEGIFESVFLLFTINCLPIYIQATNRLIVGHMSRSELVLWDWIYLAPIAMILNQWGFMIIFSICVWI